MPGMIIKLNMKKNRKKIFFMFHSNCHKCKRITYSSVSFSGIFGSQHTCIAISIHQYLGKCTLIYLFKPKLICCKN